MKGDTARHRMLKSVGGRYDTAHPSRSGKWFCGGQGVGEEGGEARWSAAEWQALAGPAAQKEGG